MNASNFGLSEQLINGRSVLIPTVFLSLDEHDLAKFKDFKAAHRELEDMIAGANRHEKGKKKKHAQSLFMDLIGAYFNQAGLEAEACFLGYEGIDRVLVKTQAYSLFGKGEPFDFEYQINCLFSISAGLQHISYLEGQSKDADSGQRQAVEHLLGTETRNMSSFIAFEGGIIYFAPLEMASHLLSFIHEIALKAKGGINENSYTS